MRQNLGDLRCGSVAVACFALVSCLAACGLAEKGPGGAFSGGNPPDSGPESALTVTSISPNSGPTTGGTSVTISGTGFQNGATVSLGGTNATGVIITSATQIRAVTPAHAAGTVDVEVTNPDRATARLTGSFTYIAAPAPTISSVSPSSGPSTGGTSVTISGTGFQSGATVTFGGANATGVTVRSSTQIQAVTPSHAAGTADVQVRNPDGQTATLLSGFTYYDDTTPPTISNVAAVNVGSSAATIMWTTDERSDSQVEYGTTSAYGNSTLLDVSLVTSHSVTLTGLSPSTLYHYRVRSRDAAGNLAVSGDFTFTTSAPGQVLFQNDFESGDFSAWDFVWNLGLPNAWTVQDEIVHSGKYAARVHYYIDGGAEHQDDNSNIEKQFKPGLEHLFVRGYVYIPTPNPAGSPNVQRKLFYLKDPEGPDGTPNYRWAVIVHTFGSPGSLVLTWVGPGGTRSEWDLAFLEFNRWYCLELEVRANTVGQSNGRLGLWVDGLLVHERNDLQLRGISTGINRVEIGRQADRLNYAPVDEYRYWDDISVDTSYIGPIAGASGKNSECENWPTQHPEWIFCDDFETGTLDSWDTSPNLKNTVSSVPENVRYGNYSLQATIDSTGDGGIPLEKWFMPGYDEIYVRFYVKFQSGFANMRSDGYGMHLLGICGNHINNAWSCYGKAGVRPNGANFFVTVVDPEQIYNDPSLRPFMFYTYYPDMDCTAGCYGNVFEQEDPKIPLLADTWYSVVARVKLNTPGQNDGLQELWISGVRKISVTNLRWRDTTELRLNEINFYFYMPGPIQIQRIWIDNVVVSRSPIGP